MFEEYKPCTVPSERIIAIVRMEIPVEIPAEFQNMVKELNIRKSVLLDELAEIETRLSVLRHSVAENFSNDRALALNVKKEAWFSK